MIDTPLTNKALGLAYAAHHGQTDKNGQPYIFPPIIWRRTAAADLRSSKGGQAPRGLSALLKNHYESWTFNLWSILMKPGSSWLTISL